MMAESREVLDKASTKVSREEIRTRPPNRVENVPIHTTPTRNLSSTYSTPGSTFNSDPDAVIIELSPRYLLAGFEGESSPQCYIRFSPEAGRRHGDFRHFLPGYVRSKESTRTWGVEYELWRNDLKDVDLGLLSDKLERIVRDVYDKHLLVDAGNARLILVIPSLVPHPVLEMILQTFFERWAVPYITLQPSTTMALVAGGLRSGVVVDIGWEETVVTALYELREVRICRSTRGMKSFTREFGSMVRKMLEPNCRFDLEYVEDVLLRIGSEITKADNTKTIDIEWQAGKTTKPLRLSAANCHDVVTKHFFNEGDDCRPDDHELPLHRLIYNCLSALPIDIRASCVSRHIFIGEGQQIIGLDSLVLQKFEELLSSRTWNPVESKGSNSKKKASSTVSQDDSQPVAARHDDVVFGDELVEERHLKDKMKHCQPVVKGVIRCVDTLGSWTGASLLASQKVRSLVEIPRDRFLSHGLSGATRDIDVSVVPSKRVSTLGLRNKTVERTSWTLSSWG